MGSDIYIKDIRKVPEHLRANLREDAQIHQILYEGTDNEDEVCLVYRFGKRSVANPVHPKVPEKFTAYVMWSLSPKYTIFMKSEKAFKGLSDSIPIHMVGSSPHFENVGELKEAIRQAEKKRYKIVYETEAKGIEKLLQSMKKTEKLPSGGD